jgi:hypothetical protein
MGAVCRAEGIVDINIGQLSQSLGEGWVVLLLLSVEAKVLQHEDIAILHFGYRFLHLRPYAVPAAGHGPLKQLREAFGHGSQPHILDDLAVGTTQVRTKDDLALFIKQVLYGGQCCLDAAIVADGLGLGVEGYIEIDPD